MAPRIFKVWSRVNCAWFILFGCDVATATVLRVVTTRVEADSLLAEWRAT